MSTTRTTHKICQLPEGARCAVPMGEFEDTVLTVLRVTEGSCKVAYHTGPAKGTTGVISRGTEVYIVPTVAPATKEQVEEALNNNKMHNPKGLPTNRKTSSAAGKQRAKIFDFPVTAVIRWMGKNNWTFDAAALALHTMGCDVSDTTVRIQLKAGKDGQRGPAAEITKSQAKTLKDAAK